MITAGVDIGSLSGEAVIMDDDKIVSYSIVLTGPDSVETAEKVMDEALEKAKLTMNDIEYVVATGYGRIVVPFADRNITEISCHGKGAKWFFSETSLILDMGGQDCKAIRVNDKGKVTNFAMNDKCAAGAGRSMEVMAKVLNVKLEDIGDMSLNIQNAPAKISDMCVLFAKSDALGLLQKGVSKNDILAGMCDGLVRRTEALLKRVGIEERLCITGGIAKNIGVTKRVEAALDMEAIIPDEPQIVGAVGAALFAQDKLKKKKIHHKKEK
ncbi:MAG: 2-hydroxyglutaryl-CoA dehydratase [Deltaproteobacteria bacterium]|nr:2-hydroxyglutaryl-CoA dehydratase [Deltaproteobacteria bacterium]